MSVKNLMFPSLGITEKSENKDDTLTISLPNNGLDVDGTKDRSIMGLISECDKVHLEFTRLFSQAVKDSESAPQGN